MKNCSLKYALLALLTILVSCMEMPQEKQLAPISKNLDNTPMMKSWFLTTGNWETDPQIYVREFGTGKDTIVMLHGGWGAEHSGMIAMVQGLEKDYKFFVHEQRGSLRSPFPDSLITYDNHIADIELLRKELGLHKLTLLGHSMGAVLACAYAQKHPEHIKKLVLLSPAFLKNPFPEEDMELWQSSQKASKKFNERKEIHKELKGLNLLREHPILSSKEETIKDRIGFASRMLYDVGKWQALNNGRALYKGNVYGLTEDTYPEAGWNFIAEIRKQAYPVSLIIGDHDFFDMGNHILRKWTTEVPRAKFTSINNAGHLPWIDQPEILSILLRENL